MAENTQNRTISRNAELSPSLDFYALLKEGISYLEQATSNIWTDFNTHDPGITILENLCYALSEVALQCDADIFDLIASSQPSVSGVAGSFLLPEEVLPTHPFTLADFRKRLLDITISPYPTLTGLIDHFQPVKGAWLTPSLNVEPIFYLDTGNEALSYESGTGITLKGLYDIQFEFNYHPDYGNINTNIIRRSFSIDESITVGLETIQLRKSYSVDIAFPYWDEAGKAWINPSLPLNNIVLEPGEGGTPGTIRPLREGEFIDYFTVLIINPANPETDPLTENLRLGLSLKITTQLINDSRDVNNEEAGFIQAALENVLTDITSSGAIFEFKEKVKIATELTNTLQETLYRNRNLCEDFNSFSALRIQEIGINMDLDLVVGANTEEVLSQVFLAIDSFFSPNIPRFDFETYRQKQQTKDPAATIADILAGPLLENGFIDENDLAGLDPEEAIYTSDVARIIMALNQQADWPAQNRILGVRNLSLSNFINNQEINLREYNCLKLTAANIYRPRLSIAKSRVYCYKQNRLITYDPDAVFNLVDRFKDATAINQPIPLVLPPIAQGETLTLGSYFSIQENFPMIFQLGKGQLSVFGSPENAAKVRQLKGYLLLFEQILADLYGQLRNINGLISIGAHERSSYYSQPLYEVPEVRSILAPSITTEEDWRTFIADPGNNYLNTFEESHASVLYSSGTAPIARFEKYIKRRNRLLTHLIGRFNEDLSSYYQQRIKAAGQAAITPDVVKRRELEAEQEILYDQSLFLKDYAEVSRVKPSGFDYRNPATAWDTYEVSGMEKRISRALGIRSFRRRTLFQTASVAEPDFQVVSEIQGGTTVFILEFLADAGSPLLRSIPYPSEPAAESAIGAFATAGQRKSAYRYETNYDHIAGTRYMTHLHDENDQRLASSAFFLTEQERATLIDRCILWLYEKYSGEGLFVLEHILLRPKIKGVGNPDSDFFLPLHLEQAGEMVKDPYSYRVSVFLPAGLHSNGGLNPPTEDIPARFGSEEFRQLAESVIRRETPAHIRAYIFWLERPEMEVFQQVYRDWLESVANPGAGGISLLDAQHALVNFLTPIINQS